MRQILVVNSLADQRFKPFFEKVFFSVGVGTVWEYYENIGTLTTVGNFQKTVGASDAVFLILSQGAQLSLAAENFDFLKAGFDGNKDIFVFEHCEDLKRISVRVPHFKHFISLYLTNAWTDYVVKLAEGFEMGKPVPAFLPQTPVGIASPATIASFFDVNSGLALFDYSTSRPIGVKTACPQCQALFDLHLPIDMKVARCQACDAFFEMKPLAKPLVEAKAEVASAG